MGRRISWASGSKTLKGQILAARQAQDRELARDGDSGDLMAALGADADKEGVPGLSHPRVQPKVGHQLAGAVEPADVADRRQDSGGDREIDAGDRHQPFDVGILEGGLGDLAIEDGEVLGKPVEFAHMPIDRARSSSGNGWRPNHSRPRAD
jgi:hypothetical protein